MSKRFEFPLSKTPEATFAEVRQTAHSNGLRFSGDAQKGQFHGLGVRGHYSICDGMIAIHIVEKPFLLPWSIVEAGIRQYFD